MYCAEILKRDEASIRQKASRLQLKVDRKSEFCKNWQKRAASSKVGKKRPDHSRIMSIYAKQNRVLPNRRKHGLVGTLAYKRWHNMMGRCYRPKDTNYKNYGARGIKVCDEWHNVVEFATWFNHNYIIGCSIERKDFNGNYEPTNCTFANSKEQARNRRTNVLNHGLVAEIHELHKDGINQREIGRRLGVHFGSVNQVVLNKTWVD